jgi:uncharacterized protein
MTSETIPAGRETARRGDWMQVASGRQFYPLDPRPEEIEIGDIAHALSHLCRFGGHVRHFYTVGEHSVRVSRVCAPEDALWGLLHDASEAYLGDVVRPIKKQPEMACYLEAEARLMAVICERFGLPVEMPASVARADEILLATEARDLMGNHCLERWGSLRDIEPLTQTLSPWHQDAVGRVFLARFRELTR